MLIIKGIEFEVEITHKRIKNLYLRLKDNKIIASAPLLMADHEVYRFIEQKRDWIYRTYDYMQYKKRITNMYKGGDFFYIYNVPYRLVRSIGKKNITISQNCIFLSYKDDSDDAIRYLYKYLDKHLLNKAQEYLEKYLHFIRDYGYYLTPVVKARIMTSKWGVCYTRKNQINISSYLIHYPLECLEYIMVHEMTHFIIPNHSKRFYDIVAKNMPDYKRANDLLKQ